MDQIMYEFETGKWIDVTQIEAVIDALSYVSIYMRSGFQINLVGPDQDNPTRAREILRQMAVATSDDVTLGQLDEIFQTRCAFCDHDRAVHPLSIHGNANGDPREIVAPCTEPGCPCADFAGFVTDMSGLPDESDGLGQQAVHPTDPTLSLYAVHEGLGKFIVRQGGDHGKILYADRTEFEAVNILEAAQLEWANPEEPVVDEEPVPPKLYADRPAFDR